MKIVFMINVLLLKSMLTENISWSVQKWETLQIKLDLGYCSWFHMNKRREKPLRKNLNYCNIFPPNKYMQYMERKTYHRKLFSMYWWFWLTLFYTLNLYRDAENTHYSKGNITFSLLAAEPVPRPGKDDFYGTPKLKEFVQASKVRVRMQDHQLVTNLRHEYFGVFEYIVKGRYVAFHLIQTFSCKQVLFCVVNMILESCVL